MKLSLTISDASPSELAKILASFGATGPTDIVTHVMPATTTAAPDDDEHEAENTNAPAFDSSGLPWDERIHAKSKGTNQDGTWRKKRGIADTLVSQVEAELRARGGSGQAAPQPVQAQPAMQPTTAVPMPQDAMPATAGVPMPQMQAAPPPVQAQPAMQPTTAVPMPQTQPVQAQPANTAPTVNDFGSFMGIITAQMSKRDGNGTPLIDANYLAQITGEIGQAFGQQLSAITDVGRDINMCNYAMQILHRDGKLS